jgi:UDP-glucose 4-epimerase
LTSPARYFVVGGAGFVGGHLVDRLLAVPAVAQVTVFDNLSSGREWHLAAHGDDGRLRLVTGDVKDLGSLAASMRGHEVVVHLASNPDISRAISEPAVDFDEGTLLTHCVLEAMRTSGPRCILYASGSGVYGDLGDREVGEDWGPLLPVSTYGASKLAGEALISAYCQMFDFAGCAFRFANVVGPRQTHGVGFDFLRALQASPDSLRILGDGTQSKSYIHVSDVLEAVLLALKGVYGKCGVYNVYNVATGDHITVREIADLAVECAGLPAGSTSYDFTGGDRGWRGDVPVVRLDTTRIRDLGWSSRLSSREALRRSMLAMREDAMAGRRW